MDLDLLVEALQDVSRPSVLPLAVDSSSIAEAVSDGRVMTRGWARQVVGVLPGGASHGSLRRIVINKH